ncbi:RHS repeat-associated core domain protein [Saprospira grandis DSM 2844]|uniref:RHS repeat-associated core domain protein n=1 Tax=Saprospira grandis DSM 2844 TaxID=694433 RepID=J0PC24_9BACT|nr:RHS repeat-associated core domain-containing protein [Saprospira grandis]EJF55182.1 RHS repeat-associated core domain protein [Saprospira grandis DSM 2844]
MAQSSYQQLELGRRRYELSNHLGNVLATVSDKSLGQDSSQTGQADYYLAQVSSASLYYPFGWEMPGRKFVSGEDYRFGFNGKEDDRDWGTQNIQDYGFRLYNPSIGKFLSVDPLAPKYPELTCYQFASNTPLWAIDLDGLEAYISTETGEIVGQIGDNNMVRTVKAENVETVCLAAQNLAEKNPSFEEKALNIDYKGIADALSEATPLTTEELNVRAFLSTIKTAEGHGIEQTYDVLWGYKAYMKPEQRDGDAEPHLYHPMKQRKGWGDLGSASGAYGFTMAGWEDYGLKKGYPNFDGKYQDQAAVYVLERYGALDFVKKGEWEKALPNINVYQWPSLPGGNSGQQGLTLEQTREVFKANVIKELNNKSSLGAQPGELDVELDKK